LISDESPKRLIGLTEADARWFDGLATLEKSLQFRFSAVYVIMVGPKCELSVEVFDVMTPMLPSGAKKHAYLPQIPYEFVIGLG
jgi:hypothetical protein